MKKIIMVLLCTLTMVGCANDTKELTTTDIYNMFIDADLHVTDYIDYTEETDPNSKMGKPGEYIAKMNFAIDGIEQLSDIPTGGAIEIFKTGKDARTRKEYIDGIGKAMPALSESSKIVKDVILIRLDRRITNEETQKYFDAVK